MGNIKKINVKNRTYYFFNDQYWRFDSNLLILDTKPYQNIDIYYTGYITIKRIS